ncbi:hypothetical protein ACOAKC_00750 [Hathewaya histolytica]|uniref:hypothetical protein n=1 Tax=Hathewaya histolytica TaxID=1498 RepID=UPI003B66E61F
MHFSKLINSKFVGVLVIADTVNPKIQAKKMQALNYNHFHTKGKTLWSHYIVTFNFVAGDISIPLNYKTYFSKENCLKYKKSFMGKSDIAADFIISFAKPSNDEFKSKRNRQNMSNTFISNIRCKYIF